MIAHNCQSGGHDALVLFIYILYTMLEEKGIPHYPWIVDFQDETMFEVEEKYKDQCFDIIKEAVRLTNERLNGSVKLTGEPDWSYSMAHFKIEGAGRD